MEQFPKPQPDNEPLRVEKISESSPEYEQHLLTVETLNEEEEFLDCFGCSVLEKAKDSKERTLPVEERLRKLHPIMQKLSRDNFEKQSLSQEEAKACIHKANMESLELFKKLMLDKRHVLLTNRFLFEAVEDPKIIIALRQEVKSISKSTLGRYKKSRNTLDPFRRLGSDPSIDSLIALVGAKKISDELWLKILENHKTRFEESLKEFNEKLLPILTEQFRTTIETAIDNSELPLTKELVENRIKQIRVTLKDGLHAALEEVGGRFYPEISEVDIDSTYIYPRLKEELKHTFFHEFFHVLSGRLITNETLNIEDVSGEFGNIHHERIGLRFHIDREGHQQLHRFRWLNEAVTERLTGKYMPPSEKSYMVYERERELFELVINKGKTPIGEKYFTDAYFENLDPKIQKENRLPAWRALIQQIELSWGSGFLNRIDVSVKKIGLAETIEALKRGDFSGKQTQS